MTTVIFLNFWLAFLATAFARPMPNLEPLGEGFKLQARGNCSCKSADPVYDPNDAPRPLEKTMSGTSLKEDGRQRQFIQDEVSYCPLLYRDIALTMMLSQNTAHTSGSRTYTRSLTMPERDQLEHARIDVGSDRERERRRRFQVQKNKLARMIIETQRREAALRTIAGYHERYAAKQVPETIDVEDFEETVSDVRERYGMIVGIKLI